MRIIYDYRQTLLVLDSIVNALFLSQRDKHVEQNPIQRRNRYLLIQQQTDINNDISALENQEIRSRCANSIAL